MFKYKNWSLFEWALRHLKIDSNKNSKYFYKKCFRNDILLKLMDLSGVKPWDIDRIWYSKNMIIKEIETIKELSS